MNNGIIKYPSVSVVIPCFNGEKYIAKTINSVLHQHYPEIEMIIVNDGSKDSTYEILKSYENTTIRIINKPNTGVSDSRNIGMGYAGGAYILFLDADDILEPDFISKRVELLEKDTSLSYCTGEIVWINELDNPIEMPKKQYGIYENITRNVASFNPLFSTCPSAYLFRMEVVKRKKLQFNIRLSSPADRYFLLELGNEKGALVKDGGKLLYRINTYSMSHHFSEKLIFDQENYFFSVIKNNLVSGNEKVVFIKKMCYQLFASFYRLKMYSPSFVYLSRYLKSFFL